MKCIEVVAAIIVNDNKILCVLRGENKYDYISKKFEFPGGKIEDGESKVAALKREIFEELKMDVISADEFITVVHKYPDFNLIMHGYMCTCRDTSLVLSEHIDFKWLNKSELVNLDWAAADIPIVEKLLTF